MGASASRIWIDICGLQTDHVRAHMLDMSLRNPELVWAARQSGVYSYALSWLSAYQRGEQTPFPFSADGRLQQQGAYYSADRISHNEQPRWAMYTTPVKQTVTSSIPVVQRTQTYPSSRAETQLIVSPAAKALDYFQESLALLGIDENDEAITHEKLKAGYKRASLRAHPDKGGSKEAFDEVRKAYTYVEKILNRINPKFSAADQARMTGAVNPDTAAAYRNAGAPALNDAPPVQLSAKKLDMSVFNKIFEENRMADPTRDVGYGDWLKSTGGDDAPAADPRLKGKFNQQTFETVFREKAANQHNGAIMKRLEPDAIVSAIGTELGGDTSNFTAAFGADSQFTDLKEAYTSGATMYQDVAHIKVSDRKARSVEEAERIRQAEMARVDPTEKARFAAAAAAYEEKERLRRLRLAKQDTTAETWNEQMKRRLLVNSQ